MYRFEFMNFDGECIYTVNSPKRFLLLKGDANYCLSTEEICAVDSHQDYIDELDLSGNVLNVLSNYSAKDTLLVRVNDEFDAKSELFNHPISTKCQLVICGDYAHEIRKEFLEHCYECEATGAEPVDEDEYTEDEEEEDDE